MDQNLSTPADAVDLFAFNVPADADAEEATPAPRLKVNRFASRQIAGRAFDPDLDTYEVVALRGSYLNLRWAELKRAEAKVDMKAQVASLREMGLYADPRLTVAWARFDAESQRVVELYSLLRGQTVEAITSAPIRVWAEQDRADRRAARALADAQATLDAGLDTSGDDRVDSIEDDAYDADRVD